MKPRKTIGAVRLLTRDPGAKPLSNRMHSFEVTPPEGAPVPPHSRTSFLRVATRETALLDDTALVREIEAGDIPATTTLYDRYSRDVERVLLSIIGPSIDIEDLVQEVFMKALAGIASLEEPSRLRSWLVGISVFSARDWLRRKVRKRWLSFVADYDDDTTARPEPSIETSDALRKTYEVLSRMPEEERIVFSLRFVEGLELTEVALACDLSLSTAKRRIGKAERRFLLHARRCPVLGPLVAEGPRWGTR